MSGFWGIFRPDGGPVDMEAFDQMCKASEREGFDGMETHVEDGIAMGHLMLRVSPESQYDKQPLKSDCGNYLLVGHFRLDYRDELGDKLGLTQSELEKTPDSRLAMMAYIKWKEKCVHHLEGDWACGFYKIKTKTLTLFKDQLGYSAIFYMKHGQQFLFTSNLNYFKTLNRQNLSLNFKKLLNLDMYLSDPESTLIDGAYKLKCGHYLIFNCNQKLNISRYFILQPSFVVRFKSYKDFVLEFKSKYQIAIKSSIVKKKKSAIMLSSGLDSTSVAYFTSKGLQLENETLFSITSYPCYIDNIPIEDHKKISEVELVKKFILKMGNIEPVFISLPDVSQQKLLESTLTQDLNNPILTSNTFWLRGVSTFCNERGIKNLYTGQLGNLTLSWNAPFNYIDLFLKGSFFNFFNKILSYAKKHNLSLSKSLYRCLLAPTIGQIRFFGIRSSIFRMILNKRSPFFVKKVNLGSLKSLVVHDLHLLNEFNFYNSKKTRLRILDYWSNDIMNKIYTDFSTSSIQFIDPTANIRFLQFSIDLPENIFNDDGIPKKIYKDMMAEEAYPEIINQDLRILQSLDFGKRLEISLDFEKIEIILECLKNYLDVEVVRELISKVKDPNLGYLAKRTYGNELIRKLSIVYFLNEKCIYLPK